MLNDSAGDIARTVERLRALGVESVAATHCTADAATQAFGRAYGKNAVAAGVGKRFTLD
jgi:metal-dependent hydrolase (beta-lactamase superfamily II)